MPKRAHDCPACACWEAEVGESMTVYVNGIPMSPGRTRTIRPHDDVRYTFTKTTEGATP